MNRISILSIVFFLLSALAYGLIEWQPLDDDTEQAGNLSLTPDYVAENLQSKTYNAEGNLAYHIRAQKMEHYAESATTRFDRPVYTLYPSKEETWIISANEGVLYNNERVTLTNRVKISSTASQSLISEIQGKQLEIDLANNIISSEQAILIQGRDFTMYGAGLFIDLTKQQMTLTEHVHTTYEKNNY